MTTTTEAQELVSSLIAKATPITIELNSLDKTVSITKFKVRHLPTVLSVFNLVKNDIIDKRAQLDAEYDKLKAAGDEEGLRKFAAGADEPSTDGMIVNLVSKHTDALLKLIGICTALTPEEVDELDIDEVVAIIVGVVLLNKDFFMEKVLPTLTTLMVSSGKMPPRNT